MSGGPSQTDMFDMKPGHANGGIFKEIDTSVSGIRISEHLPKLAKQMQDVALIRSMTTKEGDHSRATYVLRTGHQPQGPIQYPTLGSLLSKELADTESSMPGFVSVAPYQALSPGAFGPGFLGPRYAPLVVGAANPGVLPQNANAYENSLRVENLARSSELSDTQAEARLRLLASVESGFSAQRPGLPVVGHQTAYDKAVRMMQSDAAQAFELEQEPDELRSKYGRNRFGQGCLLARRLIERGVPFVEVSHNGADDGQAFGWDTHQNNFVLVKRLSEVLDAGWATLMEDLRDRGLLETTLIIWMGEFGRTPKINNNSGRDHFPAAWSTALAGGGIRGGRIVGRTSDDGMKVEDRPVAVGDLLSTVCHALGIDPLKQNMSNVGRPIRIADPEASPLTEILA
jgi:uncharacterized protein (DUF1501 family)